MRITRRHFLQSSAGCALSLSLSRTVAWAAAKPTTLIPIGLQLYAVRGEFARRVPETLRQVAALGYLGVEFWGYGGTPNVYQQYSAPHLRRLLDDCGLECCGMHLELKALAPENLQRTIDSNRALGSSYLNVAAAQEQMKSEVGIAELAKLLNDAAEKCREHKMLVGYHAHPFDFAKINGRFAWDLLFSQTRPEVNMQMDVGNCLAGDGDPIGMLQKFPGRTRTIHIKEHQDKTFESDYYKRVFQLCEAAPSVTKWYIVEMGSAEGNGFDVPREALSRLRRLGK